MNKRGRYSPDNLIRSDNLTAHKGENVQLVPCLENAAIYEKWTAQLKNPSIPKIVDLFCGAGGMSQGFVNAGFVVAAAFDQDQFACQTFAANIPAKVSCTDISTIDDPKAIVKNLTISGIDVIIGGPPCQGFSQVGRARIQSLSQNDQKRLFARNELYAQFFRFV